MKPYRSMLFVPGHRRGWAEKAASSGADALILDLEDSVPAGQKNEARASVLDAVANLAAAESPGPDLWVRPNGLESHEAGRDLEVVVCQGLTGVFLPKVYRRDDVISYAALLTHFEVSQGLPVGSVQVMVSLETAESMVNCSDLARASERVAALVGTAVRDADAARAVGYTFTPEGLETLYIRSRVVLESRAAGLEHPICGLWQDIGDLDGLRRFAEQNRGLGYRGQLVIHPSHVPVVNEVFGISASEISFYRGMISAFDAAVAEGRAAVEYAGQHIDYAHVKTAREKLRLSDSAAEPTSH